MHPIELTVEIISSLGVLFGIGLLIHAFITSFKKTCRRILRSVETWLIALTIIFCILAINIENFFYDFPIVPLLIAALAVLLISRKLMMATVYRRSKWISLFLALLWGIWSFCIFLLLILTIIPDYPTLHHYEGHARGLHGMMLVGFAVWEMIFSFAISLYVITTTTRKQRKGE